MKPLPSPWEDLDHEPIDHVPWDQILSQGLALGLIGVLLLAVIGASVGMSIYAYYAADLPNADELYKRQITFTSTKILDRNGKLLYEMMDPQGGRRTLVQYDDLPQVVIDAVVATEDATFFSNPGVNPIAIARALYLNYRLGETKGASTITQQLVKNMYLDPDKTLQRKIKEAILATEITRRYSKEEILTLYLNESYFGNLSYGIGAASESYLSKPVSDMELHEAALLAGLLQSAVIYDPYQHPEAALARRATVLGLMHRQGMITSIERDMAEATPLNLAPRDITIGAPHMVFYVREQLEVMYGADHLYRGGMQVYTTLDLGLQHEVEEIVAQDMPRLRQSMATNAGVVVIDPHTGDILALVGSADFGDASIAGQVDVTRRLRQPGSTMKPLVYLAAFERGWTPSTLVMDLEQSFPDGANPDYVPHNYDLKTWGPISLRSALANSRNIPAVATLHQIGIPALVEISERLGITSLTRPDYGLSLALGAGDVTLLEMTGAYATLANGGRSVTPHPILRITNTQGEILFDAGQPEQLAVIDPRIAYWMNDMLSDNEARTRAFGANSSLALPFAAAAKTGTTNDNRDAWTIGCSPDLAVGVWVGNSDNAPTDKLTGSKGAGPIWNSVMMAAHEGLPDQTFVRPPGLVELAVCPVSGQAHTEHCPQSIKALFLEESLPETCQVHREVSLCGSTGKLAGDNCPEQTTFLRVYTDYGSAWDDWARAQGLEVPPREMCDLHATPAIVALQAPTGAVTGIVELTGSTIVGGFGNYVIDYGVGYAPMQWRQLGPEVTSPVDDGVLARWDTSDVPDGVYVLRLRVQDQAGSTLEARTTIQIRHESWAATPSPKRNATAPVTTPAATAPARPPVFRVWPPSQPSVR